MWIKLLILTVWAFLINFFIIPMILYGPDVQVYKYTVAYVYQIFLSMISGIIIGEIYNNYFGVYDDQ